LVSSRPRKIPKKKSWVVSSSESDSVSLESDFDENEIIFEKDELVCEESKFVEPEIVS
jgi:hypothetical protein